MIGAGEHARVVLDSLLSSGRRVQGMFDPKHAGKAFMGVTVNGDYSTDQFASAHAIIALGSNDLRRKLAQEIVHPFTNCFDTSAIISRFASFGVGNMILHGAIIQQGAVIADHTIINTGSQIDHDCQIESFVHIAPGAVLCGRVRVGEGALVGSGATIIPGITIGKGAIIGAGAVVTKDIPDSATALGVPAKVVKTHND